MSLGIIHIPSIFKCLFFRTWHITKAVVMQLITLCFLKKKFGSQEINSLKVTANGTVVHDSCISHSLLYAFGICKESHTHECIKCGQLFEIFQQLKIDTPIALHHELDDYCEHLLYYLAHQTRKHI